MSLAVIFAGVKPIVSAAIAAVDSDAPPYIALGEENLPNPTAMPAIVWVPAGGPVVPARQSGAGAGGRFPRHLWTREENVHMYVYTGSGFAETEELMGHVVAAMLTPLSMWGFRVKATRWSMGWPNIGSNEPTPELLSGTLCVVTFELNIPLVAERERFAVATTTTLDPQTMNPPGGA